MADVVSRATSTRQVVARLGLIALCACAVLAAIVLLLRTTDNGVVGTNGVRPFTFVGAVAPRSEVCQTLGTAKRRPSAALVRLGAGGAGPQRLHVSISGASGRTSVSDWADGVVLLPLPRAVHATDPGLLCIRNVGKRPVQVAGENIASATLDGRPQRFAVSVTLIGAPRRWEAQAGGILSSVGNAQAGAGGRGSGWLAVVLYAGAALLALGGGVPVGSLRLERQGQAGRSRGTLRRACALATTRVGLVFLVALLNGTAFSLLTPPFQVPDETAHFAYVQRVVEHGARPGVVGRPEFSTEQTAAMSAMGTLGIIGRPSAHPPDAEASTDAALEAAAEGAPRGDGGGPSTASGQPPLYYALTAIPYKLLTWASLPGRLRGMRLMSVFFFALGAALCALVVAEFLPRQPWAPLVGGLAVALSPYTAFIGSGVTPDTLLLAVSAGTLLLFARAFRAGLTRRRAACIGLVVGAGAVTKLTYLAFVPPATVAVAYLVLRDRDALKRLPGGTIGCIVAAVIAAASLPALAYGWAELSTSAPNGSRGAVGIAVEGGTETNYKLVAVYAWELVLPRLPFMPEQFRYSPPLSTWLDGFAGRYGWLDYGAPAQVNSTFRCFAAVVGLLALAALALHRRAVFARRWLVVAYAAFAVALVLVIAKTSYDYRRDTGFTFEQPRYLFGVASLYSLAVAVACLGLGRRAAPLLATVAVTLFALHDLTGITQTLVRYYG